ncbi:hypothetical protein JD844_015362 [Phrynosoma platyrhinos]|uniref:Uncharacterized protein n=1 Tax=Phrynosoma platyrhinos TaxID=52577 RepID=A0ABQ7SIZ2_PHRPL|nr:hypothetical protein JD844_015362 [Phrynosoma platyrhinos]
MGMWGSIAHSCHGVRDVRGSGRVAWPAGGSHTETLGVTWDPGVSPSFAQGCPKFLCRKEDWRVKEDLPFLCAADLKMIGSQTARGSQRAASSRLEARHTLPIGSSKMPVSPFKGSLALWNFNFFNSEKKLTEKLHENKYFPFQLQQPKGESVLEGSQVGWSMESSSSLAHAMFCSIDSCPYESVRCCS